ncbi:MAG: hypothetical protein AB1486_25270 [Planctomycetota bacterium]
MFRWLNAMSRFQSAVPAVLVSLVLSRAAGAGEVLFYQAEFDDLSAWTQLEGSWVPAYDGGELFEAGVPPTPVAGLLLEGVAPSDCAIGATVRLAGASVGLIARWSNERNFYLLALNRSERRLLCCSDGQFTTLASQSETLSYQADHTVVLSCIGSRIQAFVDNARILDVMDDAHRSGGGGLFTARSFQTSFDNVVVTAVGPGGWQPGFDPLPDAEFVAGSDAQDLYDLDTFAWDPDTLPEDLSFGFRGDIPGGVSLEVDENHLVDASSDGVFEGPFDAQAAAADGTWVSYGGAHFDAEPPRGDNSQGYPRLFRLGFQPGDDGWSQGAKVEFESRFDLVLWRAGYGAGRVAALKVRNPSVKIIATTMDYIRVDPRTGEFLDPEEYVVRDSAGQPVMIDANFGVALANISEWEVKIDGVGPAEYLARRHLDAMDVEHNPWDGVGHDWMGTGWWKEPKDFDYNRDGINDFDQEDALGDPVERYRNGNRIYLEALGTEFKRRTGRDPIVYYNPGGATDWLIDDVSGHLVEGYHLGGTWWQVFDDLNRWAGEKGKYWLFTNKLGGSNWENNAIPEDSNASLNKRKQSNFRYMRYGLTMCLMAGGYYDISGACEHEFGYWYDEFELDLGQPRGTFYKLEKGDDSSHQGGDVYVRFFDNGVAIHYAGVNSGEATVTVTDKELRALAGYDGPYYRFRGGQDPAWNDGILFEQVTMKGKESSRAPGESWNGAIGDGIVLLKEPAAVVTDIIIGNDDVEDTNPGSYAAEFTGPWENKSYMSTKDPATENPYWAKLVYNGHIDFGDYDSFGHKEAAPGSHATALYTPTIGVPGTYAINEWHGWIGSTDAEYREATNVKWELQIDGGTVLEGTINQNKDKGKWNLLGTTQLPAGRRATVVIYADGADARVIGDAMMFHYVGE